MPIRTEYFDEKDAIVTAVLLGDFEAVELLVKRAPRGQVFQYSIAS